MKFRVTLDDAQGFEDALATAVFRGTWAAEDDNDQDTMVSARTIKIKSFLHRWVDSDRYLTVEFDTETGTAAVVPLKP